MFFLEINMVSCSNPKFLHASPTDLGLKNQIDYGRVLISLLLVDDEFVFLIKLLTVRFRNHLG